MKEMLATIHVRCASDTAFRSGAPTAAALAEVADLGEPHARAMI